MALLLGLVLVPSKAAIFARDARRSETGRAVSLHNLPDYRKSTLARYPRPRNASVVRLVLRIYAVEIEKQEERNASYT